MDLPHRCCVLRTRFTPKYSMYFRRAPILLSYEYSGPEHRAFRHVSSKGKGRGGSKQGKAKASLMGACGSQSKLQNPSPKS